MEIKEQAAELMAGLKERMKSSFLLTFVVIWCIHHWRLIFIFFNFDEYYYLTMKIATIEAYLEKEGLLKLWLQPVGWTFLSLAFFYLFSVISELLNIIFHNTRKRIYSKWDSKKLKYATEYDEQQEHFEKISRKYRDLVKENTTLIQDRKDAEEQTSIEKARADEVTNANKALQKKYEETEGKIGVERLARNNLQQAKQKLENELLSFRGVQKIKDLTPYYSNDITGEKLFSKMLLVDLSIISSLDGQRQNVVRYVADGKVLRSFDDPDHRLVFSDIVLVQQNEARVKISEFKNAKTPPVEKEVTIKYVPSAKKFIWSYKDDRYEATPTYLNAVRLA
jgi:hypothetical protein